MRVRQSVAGVGAAVLILALAAPDSSAGAARTRPGGGSSGGGAPVRSGGRATYGYGPGGGYVHGPGYAYYPWGWYGGYSPGWWYGPGWGWYGYPYRVVPVVVGPSAGPGTVEFDVKPSRASVRVDGEIVGKARQFNGTWDALVLEPGRHIVELEYRGYKSLKVPLDVKSATRYRVIERLERGEGLDPRSEKWDDRPPPPEGESRSSDRPDSTEAVPRPALRKAFLRFTISPSDAAVYLDGQFLASGDELSRLHGALAVAEGDHVVEVVRPGFASRRIEVRASGETPIQIRIDLESP